MNKIYQQLANHLDQIPNGFPSTDSGVEKQLLAKLFTEEEARVACAMSLDPETPAVIAERLGEAVRETANTLKSMVKKGLIDLERGKGTFLFKLIPFIVGFYERQNAGIDKEFARLFEQYYHEALYKMMTISPSVHRVIPVEITIPVDIHIMPYERASFYLENAESWGVLHCICRVQKALIGESCEHTTENCLVFSSRSHYFDRADRIRAVTKEEALEILDRAHREGLVHSTSNVQNGVDYICNCCSCACGMMRGITQYGSMNAMAKSDFLADIETALCTGCGICIDKCPFNALQEDDGICRMNPERCFGCGLCVTVCPSGALQLRLKPNSECGAPPLNESDWRIQRSKSRSQH